MTAVEMAARYRAKTLSPVEVMDAVFKRINEVNPRLNAYCTLTEEEAMAQARAAEQAIMRGDVLGPLHGIPVSVKDLLVTAGVRTMRGSAIYEHTIPEDDSPAVAHIKRAGAILTGKTTTPEFGWKGETDSPVTGFTKNPWDHGRTAGGSSGGAAVAVATGMGPMAVGTDGAGSIRIPASLCGIFGFKPSAGRVAGYPPSSVGVLSHVGPMTRAVRDAALMLQSMVGPDGRDPYCLPHDGADFVAGCEGGVRGLRIAWSRNLGYAPVNAEVGAITSRAAEVFAADLGCSVEERDPGFTDPQPIIKVLWASGLSAALRGYLPEWRARMDPNLVRMIESRDGLSAADHAGALAARVQLFQQVERFFEGVDLLVTPTMPTTTWPLAGPVPYEPDGVVSAAFRYTPFTFPFNITGQPAATVPCGFDSAGLPVGLQIVGPRFADARVLRAAAAFEAACPWAHRRPVIA